MKNPSDIVRVAEAAMIAARRIGREFKLDDRRLESFGFSQAQIDAIHEEIDHLETMFRIQQLRYAKLDATT